MSTKIKPFNLHTDTETHIQTLSQAVSLPLTGGTVTGAVTANELTIDSVNVNGATIAWQNGGINQTYLFTSGSSEQALILRLDNQNLSSTGYFEIQDGSAGRKLLNVDDNGDISFYEDTGTTAKLFWDASEERLGIGTSSPSFDLELNKSSAPTIRIEETTNSVRLDLRSNSDHTLIRTTSNHDMRFNTNQVDRMTIKNNVSVKLRAIRTTA